MFMTGFAHRRAAVSLTGLIPCLAVGMMLTAVSNTAHGGTGGSDSCTANEAITGPGPFLFDNQAAFIDGLGHADCNFFDQPQIDHDVWFCWTAPLTPCESGYVVETCGHTSVDTKFAVYAGCGACPPTTPIECAEDDCGSENLQSRIIFTAIPGQSYRIRMGTFPGASGGTGHFTVACATPPDNDDCENAEAITGEDFFPFDNIAATPDGPLHAQCSTGREPRTDHDLWYCWTSPCTGTVFAQTCDLTVVDTKLLAYDGCECPANDGRLLGCNDDEACDVGSRQSQMAFEAETGSSYLIRVGTFSGAKGGLGELEITCGIGGCPAAGDCFTMHNTGGCSMQECCETVCAVDRFCCAGQWDNVCARRGSGLCGGSYNTCGPGRGSCTNPDGDSPPGCDNIPCCNEVCAVDPFCCTANWDDVCSAEAAGLCGATGFETCGPPAGSCPGAEGNGGPGCDDEACCNAVCAVDPLCCINEWDPVCALREAEQCQGNCGPGAGDCFEARQDPGCDTESCCSEVCEKDPFCCFFEWDSLCVTIANERCPLNCPTGTVTFTDPPNNVVYAGFPRDPFTGVLRGPRTFHVTAPSGGESRCWSLCETDENGEPNSIALVQEHSVSGGSATYLITLERPITGNAVTTLTYTNNSSGMTTGTFISHPANVDGSSLANSLDVVEMVNCCLNGSCTPEWGDYSCDIDGSGNPHPPDLNGVIDMLNGAGPFLNPSNNTSLPTAGSCP